MNKIERLFVDSVRYGALGGEIAVCDVSSFAALVKLAAAHCVEAFVGEYAAMLPQTMRNDEDFAVIRRMARRTLMQHNAQKVQFDAVSEELERQKVSFIPLKGFRIKSFYRAGWMRRMTDIDCLIHTEDAEKVHDIMRALGYSRTVSNASTDVYNKPPFVCFEFHKEMFVSSDERCRKYFADIWQRVNKDYGCCELELRDQYVYFCVHAAKHFFEAGTGIRTVLDFYMLNRNLSDADRTYCRSQINQLGFSDFNDNMCRLAEIWFGGEKENDSFFDILGQYVVTSGLYGTRQNIQSAELAKKDGSTAKYLLGRIFLTKEQVNRKHPVTVKHPVLIPYYQLKRMACALGRRHKISEEISGIMDDSPEAEKSEQMRDDIRRRMGFRK